MGEERRVSVALGTLVGYRIGDVEDRIRLVLLLPDGRGYGGFVRVVRFSGHPGVAFEGMVSAVSVSEESGQAVRDDNGVSRVRLEPVPESEGMGSGSEFGGVLRVRNNKENGHDSAFDLRAEYCFGGDVVLEGAVKQIS